MIKDSDSIEHFLPVCSFHGHPLWSFSRIVFKLNMVSTNQGNFDEITIGSLTMYDNHSFFGCGLELKINVTRESHVKGWQFNDSIVSSECDNVVKEHVSVTIISYIYKLGVIQKPRGQLQLCRLSKICYFCPRLVQIKIVYRRVGGQKRAKLCPRGY